ncbi:MerR family DNA-binding transcriptional regulator [soil metagenome]
MSESGTAAHGADFRGIQDVAAQLGVTHRTLRFYEDKGLIMPQRVGSTRIYSRREVARIQLILRGKKLGFSIREITEFLDLYDADPQHVEQMRKLSGRISERLVDLEKQQVALSETIDELRQIHYDALQWIGQQQAGSAVEESG